MNSADWWEFSRRIEIAARTDYEGGYAPPNAEIGRRWAAAADAMPAQIERCRIAYDADGNPSHVWEGILCASIRARYSQKPMELPSWIAAYLGRVAGDICGAVAWPEGDRRRPAQRTIQPDGSLNVSGGPTITGVTAEQRRDAVLDALGFRRNKGGNPVRAAHKLKQAEALVRAAEEAKANGQRVRDVPGASVSEPYHKLKRARRRVERTTGAIKP